MRGWKALLNYTIYDENGEAVEDGVLLDVRLVKTFWRAVLRGYIPWVEFTDDWYDCRGFDWTRYLRYEWRKSKRSADKKNKGPHYGHWWLYEEERIKEEVETGIWDDFYCEPPISTLLPKIICSALPEMWL